MIRLEGIRVEREGRLLLDDISLDFAAGQHWVIWGDNGAGKTTLARVLAGLLTPDDGAVVWSEDLAPPLPLLFQDPDAQMAAASVRDEVALGCRQPDEPLIHRKDPGPAGRRLQETLAAFQLLDLAPRNPHSLSGGEKRRLNLAALAVLGSPALILDEPELHMDEEAWRDWVDRLDRRFAASPGLLVEISRAPERAQRASRLAVLHEGRLLAAGEPEQVYREIAAAHGRGQGPLLPAVPEWEIEPEEEAASGVPEGEVKSVAGGAPLLVAEGLGLDRPEGGGPLLDDLSLELRQGERLLILGKNGSGKTSLLLLLADLADPDRGRVYLQPPLRAGLAMQEPERACFAETVAEEVGLGPRREGLSGDALAARVNGALAGMGLSPAAFLQRDPFTLSAGELRRVALAAVLALEPAVLLLDEPGAALDPSGRLQLRDALAGWPGGLIWADCRPTVEFSGWWHRCLRLEGGRLVEVHA